MIVPVVDENSTHWVTVTSYDRDSVLEVPTTFTWDLHDAVDGTALSIGNVETADDTVTITIAHEYNQIRHDWPYEKRVITVTTTFGGDEQLVRQHFYLVKNLMIPTSET